MSFLRKFAQIAFIIACVVGSYLILSIGPCDYPIKYRIGDFDDKFGISRTDFMAQVARAERVWEDVLDKELFVYDSNGSMPINLVYDTRQATADKNKGLSAEVDSTVATADSVKVQLESLKAEYDINHREYLSLKSEFESKLSARKTNRDELVALQSRLNEKVDVVNDLAREVNSMVARYNSLVRDANKIADEINQTAGEEFEQGEYIYDEDGARINVYEFDDTTTLARLLVHEMGHALGIDHNDNPDSVMYYLNNGNGLKLSPDDISGLKTVCGLK